jgi:hypothetical protein
MKMTSQTNTFWLKVQENDVDSNSHDVAYIPPLTLDWP